MVICLLADRPQWVSTVATWVFREWGHFSAGLTLGQTVEAYRVRAQRGAIPLALVALKQGQPVGTASMVAHDLTTRPELFPWLASVYVLPEQRGRGIGTALVQRIEREAQQLDVGTLYLITPDRMSFYRRLGWVELECTHYRNEDVTVMGKDVRGQLTAQARP